MKFVLAHISGMIRHITDFNFDTIQIKEEIQIFKFSNLIDRMQCLNCEQVRCW
jgi:hypothetical protein